jgi:Domain of unknown function (DUF4267)
MSKSERETAVNAIAVSRIVVGSSAWLTPNLAGRLFGLDPEGNPQLPYVGRLFGARDVALGAGALRSSRKNKDAWLTAGLACDVADVAAGVLAGARGQLPAASAALVSVTAASFAAAGLWLLQQ